MQNYRLDTQRLLQLTQPSNLNSSRISNKGHQAKFIRKPMNNQRQLKKPDVKLQTELQIRFYSPKNGIDKNIGSFKSNGAEKKSFQRPGGSDKFIGARKSTKELFQKNSDKMSSEKTARLQKDNAKLQNQNSSLKKYIHQLEQQLKLLRNRYEQQQTQLKYAQDTLNKIQAAYQQKIADLQDRIQQSQMQIGKMQTTLRSKDQMLRKCQQGTIKQEWKKKISQLENDNILLAQKLNKKCQELKYQDIQLGMLRKKKMTLQIQKLKHQDQHRKINNYNKKQMSIKIRQIKLQQ